MARERSPWRFGPNRPGSESVASQGGSGSESVGDGKREREIKKVRRRDERKWKRVIGNFGVGI